MKKPLIRYLLCEIWIEEKKLVVERPVKKLLIFRLFFCNNLISDSADQVGKERIYLGHILKVEAMEFGNRVLLMERKRLDDYCLLPKDDNDVINLDAVSMQAENLV